MPTAGELCLTLHHDEDADIYLNGSLIKSCQGFVADYVAVPLSAEAAQLLKTGENLIAVHCHQTQGGQYLDVGLAVELEP